MNIYADIFSSLLQNKHDFQLFVLESFVQIYFITTLLKGSY
jgi:hypothetical protein